MLKGISTIISPELIKVLMEMGHGDELVIADGNFPAASVARRLIRADGLSCTPLLDAILQLFPLDPYVEKPVGLMAVVPGDPYKPVIWDEYRKVIVKYEPGFQDFEYVERFAFYERAKQAYTALNDYVTKEYVKTKTLEEALQQINELQNVEKQLVVLGEDKENIKNEREPIEADIATLEEKINELKSKGPIDKLNMVNSEIESLSTELKHELRHLQKPFIKMQALATGGGGGGITPDELNKINHYLEKPFDAFVCEKPGYPLLKEILQKLEGLLSEDKLKLKPEKARKAADSVAEILHKDSLVKLQMRCTEMATNKDQLLASAKMDEINQNIAQYQEQVNLLKARKTSVETHETVKENAYKEAEDKISSLKRTIEKNVYSSIDKKIQII